MLLNKLKSFHDETVECAENIFKDELLVVLETIPATSIELVPMPSIGAFSDGGNLDMLFDNFSIKIDNLDASDFYDNKDKPTWFSSVSAEIYSIIYSFRMFNLWNLLNKSNIKVER